MKDHRFWLPPDGNPTRLLVLRHGEVDESCKGFLYGQMDVALSPRGMEQSREAGRALAGLPIRAVYASNLARARFLAHEIARHHGLQPRIDDRLRERSFGHWQGLPWGTIESDYPEEMAAYSEDRYNYRVPGDSENFRDVQARIRPFLQEVVLRHPAETVAIAAHSGPIRVMLAEMLQMPLESIFTFEQDYCCLNVIDVYPSGRLKVRLLNGTDHLNGLGPG